MKTLSPKYWMYRIINAAYWRSPVYRTSMRHGAGKFRTLHRFNLEMVAVGADEAIGAFRQSEYGDDFRNWALPAQSPEYDYSILKNYFSYLAQDAVVLITITPASLISPLPDQNLNCRYYTILHPATIHGFDDEQRTKAYRFQQNPASVGPTSCVRTIATGILAKLSGLPIVRHNKNSLKSIRTCGYKIVKEYGNGSNTKTGDNQAPRIIADRLELLKAMTRFCRERDLNPVIVIPPYPKALRDMIDTTVDFEGMIKDACIGAPVVSYYKDMAFADLSLYESAAVLNPQGAALLHKHLHSDLKELKLQ